MFPTTPLGWFGLILLSIAFNIVAAYLKPYADRFIERYSKKRRTANKKKQEKTEELIQWFSHDATAFVAYSATTTRIQIFFGIMVLALLIVLVRFTEDQNRDLLERIAGIFSLSFVIVSALITYMRMLDRMRIEGEYRFRSREQFEASLTESKADSDLPTDPPF